MTTLDYDMWTHFAVSKDQNFIYKIYKNGILVNTLDAALVGAATNYNARQGPFEISQDIGHLGKDISMNCVFGAMLGQSKKFFLK